MDLKQFWVLEFVEFYGKLNMGIVDNDYGKQFLEIFYGLDQYEKSCFY